MSTCEHSRMLTTFPAVKPLHCTFTASPLVRSWLGETDARRWTTGTAGTAMAAPREPGVRSNVIFVVGLRPSVARREPACRLPVRYRLEEVGRRADDRRGRSWVLPTGRVMGAAHKGEQSLGTLRLVVDQRSAPVRDQLVRRAVDQEKWRRPREVRSDREGNPRSCLPSRRTPSPGSHRQQVLATRPSVVTAPFE